MQNFWTLLKRFKLFWQNKVLRLLLSTPLLYGILLGYVYGGKVTDLPIVDEDRNELEGNADDNEVLDITSLLYDQNNLPKLS
jgi:hypothetical protein